MSKTADLQRRQRAVKVQEAAQILATYKAVERDLITRLEVLAEQIYEDKL